jgi:two-component system, OmpR family, sensor kinase
MSIRLRLTLLYSAILGLTLILLGYGIYEAVSNVTYGAARDAVTAEIRTVSISLQPQADQHRGSPGQYGGNYGGNGNQPGPNQGGNNPSNGQPMQNLGTFVPPADVAAQSSIQVRGLDGTVLYQSSDLKAAKATLPLSAAARRNLRAGAVVHTIATVGNQRLLIGTTLLSANGSASGILQIARSMSDVDNALTTLWKILLAGGGIATVLAFGIGWWLAGTAVRPINRITHTAREIGDTQDFGRRVAYNGPPDEVGRLASTFNTMLSRLQDAYYVQHRFVADASHELRTPLTSIRGNLGLLQREPRISEDDRVAVLTDIVSESERLSRLVGDLLTLARSDTGRPLREEAVLIGPRVTDVIRKLAVTHPDRLIEDDAQSDVLAIGDPDAITQVLLILLDNALKFTPAGGLVTVTTSTRDGRVAIVVRDTGQGIAPEDLPHVFERFYQADDARTGSGTGLGLAIAKALVDAMRGTIAVESRIGEGTAFVITLTRADAERSASDHASWQPLRTMGKEAAGRV